MVTKAPVPIFRSTNADEAAQDARLDALEADDTAVAGELAALDGRVTATEATADAAWPAADGLGGDLSGTLAAAVVGDDSHAHTASTLPAASTSVAGVSARATTAQTLAGSATDLSVTPAGWAGAISSAPSSTSGLSVGQLWAEPVGGKLARYTTPAEGEWVQMGSAGSASNSGVRKRFTVTLSNVTPGTGANVTPLYVRVRVGHLAATNPAYGFEVSYNAGLISSTAYSAAYLGDPVVSGAHGSALPLVKAGYTWDSVAGRPAIWFECNDRSLSFRVDAMLGKIGASSLANLKAGISTQVTAEGVPITGTDMTVTTRHTVLGEVPTPTAWTPVADASGTGSNMVQTGGTVARYTKTAGVVDAAASIAFNPADGAWNPGTGQYRVILPVAGFSGLYATTRVRVLKGGAGFWVEGLVNTTALYLYDLNALTAFTNADGGAWAAGDYLRFSVRYLAA